MSIKSILTETRNEMNLTQIDDEIMLNGPLSDLLRYLTVGIIRAITHCPRYQEFNKEEMCLTAQITRIMLLDLYNDLTKMNGSAKNGLKADWNEKMIEAEDLTTFIIYHSPYHDIYDHEMLKLERKILG